MKQPLIILTGPTAVGKTALSIRLAKAIGGEIISADSMQVYRHMDIGSAKVTKEEMDGVPHHLIDVLEPEEEFNVVVFKQMATEALAGIYSRGNIPIVAGGTGFYIQALLYDIDFKENEEGSAIRAELEALAQSEGNLRVHAMLQEIDPKAAGQIHPNNIKRVIRAIEYFRQTGEQISVHNEAERGKQSPYHFLYYAVTTDRSLLYRRIDSRVDQMMENGLVDEVRRLKERGLPSGPDLHAGAWLQGNPGLFKWSLHPRGGSLRAQARHAALCQAPADLVQTRAGRAFPEPARL